MSNSDVIGVSRSLFLPLSYRNESINCRHDVLLRRIGGLVLVGVLIGHNGHIVEATRAKELGHV